MSWHLSIVLAGIRALSRCDTSQNSATSCKMGLADGDTAYLAMVSNGHTVSQKHPMR